MGGVLLALEALGVDPSAGGEASTESVGRGLQQAAGGAEGGRGVGRAER